MEIRVVCGDIREVEADALLVNLFEGTTSPGGATGVVDRALDGLISQLIAEGEIRGKLCEVALIHTFGKINPRRVAVLGLGKREKFGLEQIRRTVGEGCRRLRELGVKRVASILHGGGIAGMEPQKAARAIIEGCLLGLYQFKKFLTKDEGKEIAEFILVERNADKIPQIEEGVKLGEIIARAVNFARDLSNAPANFMTPHALAQEAEKIAREYKLGIEVLDKDKLSELGMGALLGVAQGSAHPPKLIILEYRGDKESSSALGWIGKGVTFDSGGISLKPSEDMWQMKGDMSGAAAVLGAMMAVAQLKLRVNITAIIPAVENLPSGSALKPGDVLKAFDGRTIEIISTDAEGRLILADALSYARKRSLSPIIDLATLTAACHVALGDHYSGAFSNDQELWQKVLLAGKEAGERHWAMPLEEDYKEQLKSELADIKNVGGKWGGAITGALFLSEFVQDTPWVHLDIAGPVRAEKDYGYLVKGATGFGTATLIEFALKEAK